MSDGSPEEQELGAAEESEPGDFSEEEKLEHELALEAPRELYNGDSGVLDFRRLRVTDLRDNPRVILPQLLHDESNKVRTISTGQASFRRCNDSQVQG